MPKAKIKTKAQKAICDAISAGNLAEVKRCIRQNPALAKE